MSQRTDAVREEGAVDRHFWHVRRNDRNWGSAPKGWILAKAYHDGSEVSRWFKTEEAANEALDALRANGTCMECGDTLDLAYSNRERIIGTATCGDCLSWVDRLAKREDPRHVVIGGRSYWIEPDLRPGVPSHVAGFGGARHVIAFFDGRRVTSHNLWTQGNVPPHFRERLPDNAQFANARADSPSPEPSEPE